MGKSVIWKILKAFTTNFENNHKEKGTWQEQGTPQAASDKFFAAGYIRSFQKTEQKPSESHIL